MNGRLQLMNDFFESQERPTLILKVGRNQKSSYWLDNRKKEIRYPKKYPQYFAKNWRGLITSENDDLYGWNSGVEPKKPIPAELKESFEKDFDLFKEITLNVYIDDNLKTNNKDV